MQRQDASGRVEGDIARVKKGKRQDTDRVWVETLLREAQDAKWYGRLIIEVKKGEVVLATREETLKPPEPS